MDREWKAPTFRLDAELARSARSISTARGVVDVARFWALVVAALAAVVLSRFNAVVCVGAVFAIAKAQNSLMLLAHEAGHYLLFANRKTNELVGEWLTAAPLGIRYRSARISHNDHHRYLSTPADVELDLHDLPEGTRAEFVRERMLPLAGEYLYRQVAPLLGLRVKSRHVPRYTISAADARRDLFAIASANGVLLVILSALDWRLYPLLWALPLITVTAWGHKAKAFLDHARMPGDPPGALYSYHLTVLDRLFFGTLQERHGEHHLNPGVPYYRLKLLEPYSSKLPTVVYRHGYWRTLVRYFQSLPNVSAPDRSRPQGSNGWSG